MKNILEFLSNLQTKMNSINFMYLSPENYFFIFFTVFGIIATLLALASTLTKEERQDVILNYFFKDNLIRGYLTFIFLGFVIPFLFYMFLKNNTILNLVLSVLLLLLFIFTFGFLFYFILSLKRKNLYRKLFTKFKEELNE